MAKPIPDIFVANLHGRFTGISATVKRLLPHQRQSFDIGLVDWGNLGLEGTWKLLDVMVSGFTKPRNGKYRIWHCRRDIDMVIGIFLRDVLRQKWRLIFTSAAHKRPGKVLNFLINRMDAVVTASKNCITFLDWHTELIHHGVDVDHFRPDSENPGMPRKHLIGTVGRVRFSKGTDLFVNAMIDLLPDYPDFSAVIAGLSRPKDLKFKSDLVQKIERAGLENRIVFLGDVDSDAVRHLYQKLCLYIATSRSEGFGLTVLEAFACETPAIASSEGEWPWLIDEQTGAVFKSGDLDDLKSNLRKILSNPGRLDAMGKSARRRVVERYSIQFEADALGRLYQRLADGEVLAKKMR